jgi:hypothetical protein
VVRWGEAALTPTLTHATHVLQIALALRDGRAALQEPFRSLSVERAAVISSWTVIWPSPRFASSARSQRRGRERLVMGIASWLLGDNLGQFVAPNPVARALAGATLQRGPMTGESGARTHQQPRLSNRRPTRRRDCALTVRKYRHTLVLEGRSAGATAFG